MLPSVTDESLVVAIVRLLPFPLMVMGVMAKAVLANATAVASVLEDLMMLIADARKVVLMTSKRSRPS